MPTSVCPGLESWLLHEPALRPSAQRVPSASHFTPVMRGTFETHLTGRLWVLEGKPNLVENLVCCKGLAEEGMADIILHLRATRFPSGHLQSFSPITWGR